MARTSSEHISGEEVVIREAKVRAEDGGPGRSGHGDKERASLAHVSRGNARVGSWGVGEGERGREREMGGGRKGRWALSPPLNSTHSLIFSILDILVRPAPDPSRGAGSETRSFFAFHSLFSFVPFPSVTPVTTSPYFSYSYIFHPLMFTSLSLFVSLPTLVLSSSALTLLLFSSLLSIQFVLYFYFFPLPF